MQRSRPDFPVLKVYIHLPLSYSTYCTYTELYTVCTGASVFYLPNDFSCSCSYTDLLSFEVDKNGNITFSYIKHHEWIDMGGWGVSDILVTGELTQSSVYQYQTCRHSTLFQLRRIKVQPSPRSQSKHGSLRPRKKLRTLKVWI